MQATSLLRMPNHPLARIGEYYGLRLQVLLVTVVLIVAALILMGFTLSSLQSSSLATKVTEDTMLEVTTIETRMLDFEGSRYGYLLSGSNAFQMRMAADDRELGAAMNKLRRSLQSDPTQLNIYDAVVPLIQKRQRLLAYVTAPEHRSEIGTSPVAREAKSLSDHIRSDLWHILDAERRTLYLNNAKMIMEARKSYWMAAGIVALAFLFGALCLLLPAPQGKPANTRGAAG